MRTWTALVQRMLFNQEVELRKGFHSIMMEKKTSRMIKEKKKNFDDEMRSADDVNPHRLRNPCCHFIGHQNWQLMIHLSTFACNPSSIPKAVSYC